MCKIVDKQKKCRHPPHTYTCDDAYTTSLANRAIGPTSKKGDKMIQTFSVEFSLSMSLSTSCATIYSACLLTITLQLKSAGPLLHEHQPLLPHLPLPHLLRLHLLRLPSGITESHRGLFNMSASKHSKIQYSTKCLKDAGHVERKLKGETKSLIAVVLQYLLFYLVVLVVAHTSQPIKTSQCRTKPLTEKMNFKIF